MQDPAKIVAVYIDYPHYIKPKEVVKVFKLFAQRRKYYRDKNLVSEQERMERHNKCEEVTRELRMVLDVICAAEDRTYKIRTWESPERKEVTILEIFEPVMTSLFDKPQET